MTRLVLAAPGNAAFASALTAQLGATALAAEFRRFPDEESYVRVDGDCDGADVLLVATLHQPDPQFLTLVYAAEALRARGARHVTLVAPYLAYMRQDTMFREGEAVTAPIFARLVSQAFDRLITVDPHLHRIENLEDVYEIPAVNVHAAPALAEWIAARVDAPLLVGPDSESKQWVSAVAQEIDAPYVALEKVRRGDRNVEVSVPHLDQHRGCTPVIIDDIISTARTMIETVRHLTRLGTKPPICVGVHGIFVGDAHAALLAAGAGQIATTNSIPHFSNAIDLAPLVARALTQ